jgi:hypothetical protein
MSKAWVMKTDFTFDHVPSGSPTATAADGPSPSGSMAGA